MAQALIGALVTVSVNSGSQLRGTLEQCSNRFELVLVNVSETSSTGAMSSRSRVEVTGEQVVGIEFARAIDVHRLMRTKEKRAMGQRKDKSKRARQPDTHESKADDESLATIVVNEVAEPRLNHVAKGD